MPIQDDRFCEWDLGVTLRQVDRNRMNEQTEFLGITKDLLRDKERKHLLQEFPSGLSFQAQRRKKHMMPYRHGKEQEC